MSTTTPRTDSDTYELIDTAVEHLAHRRGANLGDEHDLITLLASLIDQAQRWLPMAITNARLNGSTWEQIARSLGCTTDEARLRFDPDLPTADGRWPYDID